MDTEKADFDELVAEVCEESVQHMVRLNVFIVGRNRAEKLARSLVAEPVIAVDVVAHQLGYDAVSRFRRGPERLYSAVSVPCSVGLTRISGVPATSIRRKDEGSRVSKESEPAEGRPAESQQGSARASQPRGSGSGRSSCH